MTEYLQRIRVIAVQASNDTYGEGQRRALQVGVDGLLHGFDDTWRSVNDGTRTIQVGVDAGDTLDVPGGVEGERSWNVSVMDAPSAKSAIEVLDEALDELYAHRAEVGAAQNRLERILGALGATADAEQVAASRLTDVDLGKEVVELLRSRTWAQAGAQMLSEVQAAGRQAVEILLESVPAPMESTDGERGSASPAGFSDAEAPTSPARPAAAAAAGGMSRVRAVLTDVDGVAGRPEPTSTVATAEPPAQVPGDVAGASAMRLGGPATHAASEPDPTS